MLYVCMRGRSARDLVCSAAVLGYSSAAVNERKREHGALSGVGRDVRAKSLGREGIAKSRACATSTPPCPLGRTSKRRIGRRVQDLSLLPTAEGQMARVGRSALGRRTTWCVRGARAALGPVAADGRSGASAQPALVG